MPGQQVSSVRLTPAQARPGESVLAEALDASGQLVTDTDVVINGVRGARQFVQFDSIGDYQVLAVAGEPGAMSAQSASVTVAHDAGAAEVLPARFPILQARRPAAARAAYSMAFNAQDTDAYTVGLARAFADDNADPATLTPASTVTSWTWDFGTGDTAHTTSPEIEYDFEAHLAVDQEHQLFDVSCQLTMADGTTSNVTRTLSVVNAYAVCRARGVLAPPVTAVSPAKKVFKAYQANAVVRNPEAFPVTLTSRRFQWGEAQSEQTTALTALDAPIVIPEGAGVTLSVSVGFDVVPAEVHSFNVLWLGHDDSGRIVHIETTFDVPLPDHRTLGARWGQIAMTRMLAHGLDDVAQFAGVDAVQDPGHDADIVDSVTRLHERGGIGDLLVQHEGGGAVHEGFGHVRVQRGGIGGIGAVGGIGGVGGVGAVGGVDAVGGIAKRLQQQAPVGFGDLRAQNVQAGHGAVQDVLRQVPVDRAPVEQLPVEQLPVEQLPVEQVPVEAAGPAVAAEGLDVIALRSGVDLAALNAVALPEAPVGVNTSIVGSLTELFADDALATVLTRGSDAGQNAGAAGRVSLSSALLDLGGWAKLIQIGINAPDEGKVCDPDNLPDDAGEDWACQIVPKGDGSPEMVDWHRPARFVNARKGDLILAPGGPAGFIGGLLGQVTPPQRYAHMGIMSRNYDMITHCTFADERLKDHPNGAIDLGPFGSEPAPTQGFEPDVLRYGWPGTITQWIGGATDTGKLADPAAVADPTSVTPGADVVEVDAVDPDGKPRKLAPFDRYPKVSFSGESWQVVPPLVIKPNPALETTEVRQALHRLADACRQDTGKTHYSFFAYSDARKALTDTSTVAGAWHEGTYPAVCSSFIWAVARRLGLQLEGPGGLARPSDLEATDSPAVEVGDGTPDGLYFYTEDERTQAAHWFHERLHTEVLDNVKEKVKDKIGDIGKFDELFGGLINLFSDMADDVANQMCNAFASDWCDTDAKDSDRWSSPGTGIAVSPDDTMRWDGPDTGGLFGYAVPAVYAPPTVEQGPKYAWHFAPTKGTVRGTVRADGAPKQGALVQVNDSAWGTTHTHADGTYSLPKVPFGRYEVKAQYDRGDGALYNGSQTIDLEEVDRVVDFGLSQPREANRLIAITGSHYYMKYYVIGRNPRTEPAYPFAFSRGVTPVPDSMRTTAFTGSDFHGIFGVSSFLFNWLSGGTVQWAVNWSVCQDSALADKVAHALTDGVDTLSFGFIPDLFGSEVKGQDMRTGILAPGAVAEDSIRIGPDDGTTGLLSFRLENLQL